MQRMNMNSANFRILPGLFVLAVVFLFSSCKDKIPAITNLKVCTTLPNGSQLCDGDQSIIPKDAPAIILSGAFTNMEEDTPVTFTFYKEEDSGALTNLTSTTIRPSDIGDFKKGQVFNANAKLDRPDGVLFADAKLELRAEIGGELPEIQSKKVSIE